MRLKTLEIKGFKSFAHETVINFQEDVIGIVGPNGSGKSNIVDAIRWVLGEQKSRELRLDQMSSVIFNGTKKRKQSGLAQVSLTFENTKNLLPTEYHTVTVTRMLFRSGESEYRLNNVPCRLKDITSLLLDTGIGSNSYAIIALGMVDDILADKENSRRRMFEQAAGISKYKIRKRETLSKLKNTTDDLERVEDLLFEIDGQLQTLEKQAKRTRRYFELKELYKSMSVQLSILKASVLKEKQKDVQSMLTTQEDAYRQLDISTRQLEAQLQSEKKANLDKEKALSDRQRDLNQIVGEIRGRENDRRIMEQQLQFNRQNKSKLTEQIKHAQGRSQQLEEDIEGYRSKLHEEKRLEAALEEQLDLAEQQLQKIKDDHGSLKANLDVVVQEQQSIEKLVIELEKKRAVSANQIENLQIEKRRSINELESRNEEIQTLQKKIAELEQKEQKHLDQLRQLEKEEVNRQQQIEENQQKLEKLTNDIQKVNRKLDSKRNEYKLTKSMVENLEGFPESIKFLNQSKEWRDEAPLLSDLIYVSEDYRVAIENYLDPYLNYYVVSNKEEAFKAIRLLNQAQKGKANFFLLDAFQDYDAPLVMQTDQRQRAVDLIETDPAYRNLVNYLLENVLISEEEDIKGDVPDSKAVILSKSGRFIQKKYSLSGGSIGLFEGKKIGRKKNLEVLETAIDLAEQQENKLSTAFYSLKAKLEKLKEEHKDKQIQETNLTINKLAQEKVSLQTRLENFETYRRENLQKQKDIDQRIEELKAQIETIDVDLKKESQLLHAAKEKIANTDDSYRSVAEELSAASSHFNEKNIEFIRQQNKVNTIQQELSFREKQLDETQAQWKRDEQTLHQNEEEILQIQKDLDQLEKDLQAAYNDRKSREAILTEAEQSYFKARGAINELDDEIRKVNKKRQDLQSLINNLKDKLSDLRYQMTSLSERLNIEFQVQLNDIINEPPDTSVPEAELDLKVQRLKNRLDNYGEINPMAVQAYDEMKERFETITTQRDDILQAKENLLETIKEIEDTATAQFLEAFDKARLYFIDVFRSLFTADDTCDLILLEPDDPLESKIEIVAKPKGKRPQSISQLSGGEKTLTATALLFALYLLKPAPFCIFDEVDAPLDDANIEKFNRIIKKFSQDSQFIIVTHNKQTMAAVDTIYGVFMQEQGVSTVNAVDFRNFEHKSLLEAN
jgi:chromosome segregation protein